MRMAVQWELEHEVGTRLGLRGVQNNRSTGE